MAKKRASTKTVSKPKRTVAKKIDPATLAPKVAATRPGRDREARHLQAKQDEAERSVKEAALVAAAEEKTEVAEPVEVVAPTDEGLRLEAQSLASKQRLAIAAATAASKRRSVDRTEAIRLKARVDTRNSLVKQREEHLQRSAARLARRGLRSGDPGHERKRNPARVAAEERAAAEAS